MLSVYGDNILFISRNIDKKNRLRWLRQRLAEGETEITHGISDKCYLFFRDI